VGSVVLKNTMIRGSDSWHQYHFRLLTR